MTDAADSSQTKGVTRISHATYNIHSGRIEEALEGASLYPIERYISVRQNTLADHVATRPILDLCRETERLSGSSRLTLWWTQDLAERKNIS